jgi:hypothetical protein
VDSTWLHRKLLNGVKKSVQFFFEKANGQLEIMAMDVIMLMVRWFENTLVSSDGMI